MNRTHDSRRRVFGRGGRGRNGGGSRSRVGNSQSNENIPVPEGIIFYCKTHEKIVDFHPQTLNFKYPEDGCQQAEGKTVDKKDREFRPCELVYGTERSIKHYFKIPDERLDAQRLADEERAARADKL